MPVPLMSPPRAVVAVVVHVFRKRHRKTPRREIEFAAAYEEDCVIRKFIPVEEAAEWMKDPAFQRATYDALEDSEVRPGAADDQGAR